MFYDTKYKWIEMNSFLASNDVEERNMTTDKKDEMKNQGQGGFRWLGTHINSRWAHNT